MPGAGQKTGGLFPGANVIKNGWEWLVKGSIYHPFLDTATYAEVFAAGRFFFFEKQTHIAQVDLNLTM